MNKEQIIDEVYENYTNYPLATIHDHHTNILYQNIDKGWCMLNGRSIISPHPTRHLTKEQFINKCKTDPEFSEKWGLKIEERELSLEERQELQTKMFNGLHYLHYSLNGEEGLHKEYDKQNVPRRVITLEYNNEKTYYYE